MNFWLPTINLFWVLKKSKLPLHFINLAFVYNSNILTICQPAGIFKCLPSHYIPGFWKSLGSRWKVLCIFFKFNNEQGIRCGSFRLRDNTSMKTYILHNYLHLGDCFANETILVKGYVCFLPLQCTSEMPCSVHAPLNCTGLPIPHPLNIIEYYISPQQTMMVLIPHRGFMSSVSAEVPSLASSQLLLPLLSCCLFASVSHISFRFLVSWALIYRAPLRQAINISPYDWLSSRPWQLTLPQWLVGLSLFSLLGFLLRFSFSSASASPLLQSADWTENIWWTQDKQMRQNFLYAN